MKTIVIANPGASGAGGQLSIITGSPERGFHFDEWVHGVLNVEEILRPATAAAGAEAARRAAGAGVDHIVVAGGDGTLNAVVNGLARAEADLAALARVRLTPLPFGTGNDFVAGLGGPSLPGWADPASWQERRVDVGRLSPTGADDRFFINVSGAGTSGKVASVLPRLPRWLGAHLRYRLATAIALLHRPSFAARVRLDGDDLEEGRYTIIAVANGPFFGAGMAIAPDADPSDGAFDVVLIDGVGIATFVRHSKRLDEGRHLDLPFVRVRRARQVEITPTGPRGAPIETDGERAGGLPARWEIIPSAARILAPPSVPDSSRI